VVFCAGMSSREGNINLKEIVFVAGIRLVASLCMARQRVPAVPPSLARETWTTWMARVWTITWSLALHDCLAALNFQRF
jgi:hypothetical protein